MSIKPNGQGNKINKSSASSSSGQVSSSTSQKTSTSLQARLPQVVIPRTQGNRTIWGTIRSIFQNFRFSFYPYLKCFLNNLVQSNFSVWLLYSHRNIRTAIFWPYSTIQSTLFLFTTNKSSGFFTILVIFPIETLTT